MSQGDPVLYVRAHKDLEYGRVLDALEVVTRSGVHVVGMIGERAPDGTP